jgi:hypothetical protein
MTRGPLVGVVSEPAAAGEPQSQSNAPLLPTLPNAPPTHDTSETFRPTARRVRSRRAQPLGTRRHLADNAHGGGSAGTTPDMTQLSSG